MEIKQEGITKDELMELLDKMVVGDSYDIRTRTFVFGLKCEEHFENVAIMFGGYGTHFSMWDWEANDVEVIANGIIEHIGSYDTEDLDGNTVWGIPLDHCRIERS